MSTLYPNFPLGNKYGKTRYSQELSLKIDFGNFPSPGTILVFLMLRYKDTKLLFSK